MAALSIRSLFGENAAVLSDTDYRLLLLAGLLPALGSSIVSPVLDSLIGPFGASAATIGWMISAFTAPAIVAIPLAGALADRYGRKGVLVVAITLFGIGGTAVALTTDFQTALALRFLQGVGWAGMTPTIVTSIGDLYDPPTEETAQGIRFGVTGLGGAVFPLFAGLLVTIAWQFPFLLYAMAFPIALGVLIWFEEPVDESAADATDGTPYLRALVSLSSRPAVFAIVAARSLYPVVFIALMTYNSVIVVRVLGGTPVQAGLLATVAYLSFAFTATQAGRLVSALESRLALLLGANCSLGLGVAVVFFAPGIAIAGIGAIGMGVGIGILGTLYRSLLTSAAPPDLRAGLVALAEAAGRVTTTATPLLMGWIIGATTASLGLTGALRLTGAFIAIVGGGGGVFFVVLARLTGPVTVDQD